MSMMSMARDGRCPKEVVLLESLVTLENPLDLCYGGRSSHTPLGPLKVLECVKENTRIAGEKKGEKEQKKKEK